LKLSKFEILVMNKLDELIPINNGKGRI